MASEGAAGSRSKTRRPQELTLRPRSSSAGSMGFNPSTPMVPKKLAGRESKTSSLELMNPDDCLEHCEELRQLQALGRKAAID